MIIRYMCVALRALEDRYEMTRKASSSMTSITIVFKSTIVNASGEVDPQPQLWLMMKKVKAIDFLQMSMVKVYHYE